MNLKNFFVKEKTTKLNYEAMKTRPPFLETNPGQRIICLAMTWASFTLKRRTKEGYLDITEVYVKVSFRINFEHPLMCIRLGYFSELWQKGLRSCDWLYMHCECALSEFDIVFKRLTKAITRLTFSQSASNKDLKSWEYCKLSVSWYF